MFQTIHRFVGDGGAPPRSSPNSSRAQDTSQHNETILYTSQQFCYGARTTQSIDMVEATSKHVSNLVKDGS